MVDEQINKMVKLRLVRPLLGINANKENTRIIGLPRGSEIFMRVVVSNTELEAKKEVKKIIQDYVGKELGDDW